ncbi:lipoprotein [Streptomyces albiflavescens]|uniref:Lipoprotein n=1 Tax=Streptomyces albiflavescens TaxID=1623582 RepID=A0A918D1Z4_9ACTN|nr:DUF4232 domain-containing protein [Streptomyces albiflavescens]GGN57934.1 lipoprotein [Streptomyces albiflavescens]
MATFRRGAADTDRLDAVPATRTSTRARRAALLAGVALLGLLTACGTDTPHSTPQKLPGTAEPASGDRTTDAGASPTADTTGTPATTASGTTSGSASASSGSSSTGTRCHTSELRASVGNNDPGAGQENFPVVLTNGSGRTCTLRGYPGAAFIDASGKQLGPDPRRSSGTPSTVTLAPGQSAWAGLTFSNPEISGARTATPTSLLVTPPDEKDSLKVQWTQGKVPVSGNASSVSLTVVRAGTGT